MQRRVGRAGFGRVRVPPEAADARGSFQNRDRQASAVERSGDREPRDAGADHAGVIMNGTFGVLTHGENSHK
ncbi:hypothetical protein GCM10009660_43250 [Catellatospora bangladeshensis]